MPFSMLGLDSTLLDNLARLGYTEPTPVQREAIPAVLAGMFALLVLATLAVLKSQDIRRKGG